MVNVEGIKKDHVNTNHKEARVAVVYSKTSEQGILKGTKRHYIVTRSIHQEDIIILDVCTSKAAQNTQTKNYDRTRRRNTQTHNIYGNFNTPLFP